MPTAADRVRRNLISQLRRPRIEALATAIAEAVEGVTDVAASLVTQRTLEASEGAQLDQWGAVVGVARDGRSDVAYRDAIRARVQVYVSQGTIPDVLAVSAAVSGAERSEYLPAHPAGLGLHLYRTRTLTDSERQDIERQIREAMPAGVAYEITYWQDELAQAPAVAFRFDTAGQGFDQGVFASYIGFPQATAPPVMSEIIVTGGSVSALGDGSTVITYASPGGSLEYDGLAGDIPGVRALLVAGGGSGAVEDLGRGAGGGGGGGVIETTLTLAGGVYPVSVGLGGAGVFRPGGSDLRGVNGGDTDAFGLSAFGGGAGGGSSGSQSALTGGSGGGGGGHSAVSRAGAAGTPGQGNAGGGGIGSAFVSFSGAGGGGGGAGAAGAAASATTAGDGGAGVSSDITGAVAHYGGGGGGVGASTGPHGAGGIGGGGAGSANVDGNAGTDGLGGGGGGASGNGRTSGKGGDGVCIIRVPQTPDLIFLTV